MFCVEEQKVACRPECAEKLVKADKKWSKLRSPYKQANMICDEHYHYVDNSKTCAVEGCPKKGKVHFVTGCYACGGDLYKGYTKWVEEEMDDEEEDEENAEKKEEKKEEKKAEEEKKEEKVKGRLLQIFVCGQEHCQDYVAFMYGIISATSEKYDKDNHGYVHLGRWAGQTSYCCGDRDHLQ